MRWLRSMLAVLLAAGATLFAAWLLMAWGDAGAPSPTDFAREHPALGVAFGLLSTVIGVAVAWRRSRRSG